MLKKKTRSNLHHLLNSSKNNVRYYTINYDASVEDVRGDYGYTRTGIFIPKGDETIIMDVEKFDKKGSVYFGLLGVSDIIQMNNNYWSNNKLILLCEYSLYRRNQIIIISHLMLLSFHVDNWDNPEIFFTSECIHKICIYVLQLFHCRRFNTETPDLYKSGKITICYNSGRIELD